MTLEGGEARRPRRSIRREPVVDLAEWFGAHPVEATLGVDPKLDEPDVAEYTQMLGYGRLADVEGVDQLADGSFPIVEKVENPAPVWLCQHLEGRCHAT